MRTLNIPTTDSSHLENHSLSWPGGYCYRLEWTDITELDDLARMCLSDAQFDNYQGLFRKDKERILRNFYFKNGSFNPFPAS